MRLTDPSASTAAGTPDLIATSMQFLTLTLDGRSYGLDIRSVREIIRWTPATRLPNQPAHARGVINLRGTIVPVYDLRARLGGPLTEPGASHVIVVAWIGGQTIGILVDAVSDILAVAPGEVRTPPAGADECRAVTGLVSVGGERIVAVLDPAALFGRGGT